jgi:hypothetical protein
MDCAARQACAFVDSPEDEEEALLDVDDDDVDNRAAKRRGWLGFRRNARPPAVRTPLSFRGDEAGTKARSGQLTNQDNGWKGGRTVPAKGRGSAFLPGGLPASSARFIGADSTKSSAAAAAAAAARSSRRRRRLCAVSASASGEATDADAGVKIGGPCVAPRAGRKGAT